MLIYAIISLKLNLHPMSISLHFKNFFIKLYFQFFTELIKRLLFFTLFKFFFFSIFNIKSILFNFKLVKLLRYIIVDCILKWHYGLRKLQSLYPLWVIKHFYRNRLLIIILDRISLIQKRLYNKLTFLIIYLIFIFI